MDGSIELDQLRKEILSEFPDFQIVEKSESRLMRVIDVVLRIITLGRMKTFMTDYITTVGTTVYVHQRWMMRWPPILKVIVLRHERVHMRQRIDLGPVWYELTYLFLPFPTIFAIGRRNLEMRAYEETMRAYVEYYGMRILEDPSFKKRIIEHFTGAEYFWTWPFRRSLERWYDGQVAQIRDSISMHSGVSSVQN